MKDRTLYVVTRNGRRIEEENYLTHEEAKGRATALRALLKRWKDPDAFAVKTVKTQKPNRIR